MCRWLSYAVVSAQAVCKHGGTGEARRGVAYWTLRLFSFEHITVESSHLNGDCRLGKLVRKVHRCACAGPGDNEQVTIIMRWDGI